MPVNNPSHHFQFFKNFSSRGLAQADLRPRGRPRVLFFSLSPCPSLRGQAVPRFSSSTRPQTSNTHGEQSASGTFQFVKFKGRDIVMFYELPSVEFLRFLGRLELFHDILAGWNVSAGVCFAFGNAGCQIRLHFFIVLSSHIFPMFVLSWIMCGALRWYAALRQAW